MRKKFDPAAKYGRLQPISPALVQNKCRPKWLCRCDCGTVKEVGVYKLMYHTTRSCGCLQKEELSKRVTTHGRSKTPEHRIWCGLRSRCQNPNATNYHNYGGRGITVCERWLGEDGFAAFLADMGPRPSRKHSVERRDNDGPYSAENCYWGTHKEQSRNKRNNTPLAFNGETLCAAAWAERCGLTRTTLQWRLKAGWEIERALTTPGGEYASNHRPYIHGDDAELAPYRRCSHCERSEDHIDGRVRNHAPECEWRRAVDAGLITRYEPLPPQKTSQQE